jgi:hypothetical protein
MYELKKKLERYLRVNLLGPGPRLMKKEFTGPRSHEGRETLVYDASSHTNKPMQIQFFPRCIFFLKLKSLS